jgi:hypothetical protein
VLLGVLRGVVVVAPVVAKSDKHTNTQQTTAWDGAALIWQPPGAVLLKCAASSKQQGPLMAVNGLWPWADGDRRACSCAHGHPPPPSPTKGRGHSKRQSDKAFLGLALTRQFINCSGSLCALRAPSPSHCAATHTTHSPRPEMEVCGPSTTFFDVDL